MTEEDVREVERELGVTLPAFYRDVLLDYPKDLLDACVSSGDPEHRFALHSDYDSLVSHNRFMRENAGVLLDGAVEPWPEQFFVIGQTTGGDWFIDLTEGEAVWRWSLESGSFWVDRPSLAAHIEALRATLE